MASPPDDPQEFQKWIRAGDQLSFLEQNALSSEKVIYASASHIFVHSIAVPLAAIDSSNTDELLAWNDDPFGSIASYVSGGGQDTIWIERGKKLRGASALNEGINLVFSRNFEGWTGSERNYFEVNQEYSHLNEIHWRAEHSAYCRYDENGDIAKIVSVTGRKNDGNTRLVTFTWKELEEYLAIAGFVLVRMFDFTLLRYGQFSHWGDGPEQIKRLSNDFLYRQKIIDSAAYTRGVQIIRPRDSKTVSDEISHRWSGGGPSKQHVSFIAQDIRHKNAVIEISTDPTATTNYFEASNNDLPFDFSPAYFRPEVLSKYKTDREKYIIGDRDISCRTAWTLRSYDVNEAGQVFAYICDLRHLPYSELLHWKSFNELPKGGISKRAFINDFKGDFVDFEHPRNETLSILREWQRHNFSWWRPHEEELFDRANPPISSSKDEWAEAFMDLAKLIIEGFDLKFIRKRLDEKGIGFSTERKSIALLEQLLTANHPSGGMARLNGLRTIQNIRSMVKGHSNGAEGRKLADAAIADHGSYAEHFKSVCSEVVDELRRIERLF